tara:strand:- start:1576 stop:1746 length:171 start_codon:yes stop_codon:yes gene_type:complete
MAIDYYGQEIMPTTESISAPMEEAPGTMAEESPAPADSAGETKDETPTFTDDDIPF